jgi:Do/DeqQ family serine protease
MNTRARYLTILSALVLVAAISVGGGVLGARLAGGPAGAGEPSPGLQFAPTPARGEPVNERGERPDPNFDMTRIVDLDTLPSATHSEVAHSFQQQFRTVAARTLPVVVEVNVVNRVTQRTQDAPLDFFFGTPRNQPQEREFDRPGRGSGVVVARDGRTVYVLTNHHVAGEAYKIEIILHDGRIFEGSIVGSDELMDIALLSFETRDEVPIAPLGDSNTLYPGDWVFAVGNPLGFQSTITAGIVSATARTAQPGSRMSGVTDYIQTDAAVNRGNSGGPLVNLDGEVVGINTWIASQTGGSIGLGFAIPINNAKRAINDFLTTGEVAYSWLGVQVSSLGATLAQSMEIDRSAGAFVSGVFEGSPGQESGLLPGDVIVRIGDTAIDSSSTLVRIVANLEPEQSVPFELIRGGERLTLSVRTGRRTADSGTETPPYPGVNVAPLTSEVREQLGLSARVNGVVVGSVTANSAAADSGLRNGDTITAINGATIRSLNDFYRELNSAEGEVQFRIIREGRQIIVGFVKSDS